MSRSFLHLSQREREGPDAKRREGERLRRRPVGLVLAALASLAVPAAAHAGDLYGPLNALSFMEGDWTSARVITGPGAGGVSHIHADLNGRLLQRRDHVVMNGGGTFDIWMAIYADGDTLRADFVDTEGNPPIHYVVTPGPGPSAVFESKGTASTPGFRLTYDRGPACDCLHVRFEIAQPGKPYEVYSEGVLAHAANP